MAKRQNYCATEKPPWHSTALQQGIPRDGVRQCLDGVVRSRLLAESGSCELLASTVPKMSTSALGHDATELRLRDRGWELVHCGDYSLPVIVIRLASDLLPAGVPTQNQEVWATCIASCSNCNCCFCHNKYKIQRQIHRGR